MQALAMRRWPMPCWSVVVQGELPTLSVMLIVGHDLQRLVVQSVSLRHRWGGHGPSWQVAGFGEPAGHFAQLGVEVLRRSSKHIEGVLRGHQEPLHQDALGLADHVPCDQGVLQVTADGLEVVAVVDRTGRNRCVSGKDQTDFQGFVVEGLRGDAIGVQRSGG